MMYNVYIESLGEEVLVGENLPEGQALIRMRNLEKKVCSPNVVVMRPVITEDELEQCKQDKLQEEADNYDYDKDDEEYHSNKDN